MKPDTTLQLGDFAFGALEVPADITFGGAQRLSVHELVGGVRVVDSMGRSDHPLDWAGLLLGPDALQRAQYLDGLRVAGATLSLSWSQFRYLVIVRDFSATFQRSYQIAYRISCEVVADQTTPVATPGSTPIDEAVSDDSQAAATLAATVDDATLTTKMGTLQTAISAVSSFAHAAQSTIASVLQPLADVQTQVQVLLASTANAIANVATFGGVLDGNPIAVNAANLTGQVTAVSQSATLYQLRNTLGRLGGNLGAINAQQNTVATAGGNLFTIAEQQYGDAMAWTGIAKANGLTDPFIQGTQILTIPPQPEQQSGVLGA